MSFAMGDRPYDESRLGTASSFQGQASLSGLSSISGLSSLTLVDSTANLQKPASCFELDDDSPKPRSKLRLFTILFALYVSYLLSLHPRSRSNTLVAFPFPRGARSKYRRYGSSNNCIRSEIIARLCLGWLGLPAGDGSWR